MDYDKLLVTKIFLNSGDRISKQEISKLIEISRSDPSSQLVLAFIRDVFIFKDMAISHIHRYTSKIADLEKRIEDLESKIEKENGEEE